MSAPRHQGVRGEAWTYCSKCGQEYPIYMLTWQLGQLVCPGDFDDLIMYQRPGMIAAVLNSPEDEPELANVIPPAEDMIIF